jgi:hypothetical protein
MNTERDSEAGHYEVRPHDVRGNPAHGVLAVWWVSGQAPPSLMFAIAEDRLPLLGEAIARHLAGGPA